MKPAPREAGAASRRTWDEVVGGRPIAWLRSRPPGAQQREQGVEVRVELAEPDVLEHPDRADRVVRPVAHVAVVLEADLDLVGEAGLGDALRGELGLTPRDA